MTALHRAVIDGHADVVNVLLQAGCSVDKKDEVNQMTFHLGYGRGGELNAPGVAVLLVAMQVWFMFYYRLDVL